jgi:hypothetical protein
MREEKVKSALHREKPSLFAGVKNTVMKPFAVLKDF